MRSLTLSMAVGLAALMLASRAPAANQLVTSTADGGAGSLRQACLDAGDGDTVFFSAAGMNITLTGGHLTIGSALSIVGTNITVNAGGTNRAFYVFATATDNISLSGLVITNGAAPLTGAAPMTSGGGLCIDRCGTLTMRDCVVTHCRTTVAAGNGGGILTDEGLTLTGCTFTGNTANGSGGAVYSNTSEPMVIHGGRFAFNTAQVESGSTYRGGGALGLGYWNGSAATIQGGTVFTNNVATSYQGGAIWVGGNTNGVVRIDEATFVDNFVDDQTASGGAGGALFVAGSVKLTGCTFLRNHGSRGGGAVASSGKLTAIGCLFQQNWASVSAGHTAYGGAIGLRTSSPTVVSNCVFRGNSDTPTGGGAIGTYTDNTRLFCYATVFDGNRASGAGADGGAIRAQVSTQLHGCTFVTNACGDEAGALWLAGTGITGLVVNCTFSGNIAGDDGGAILQGNARSLMKVYNSTVCGNRGDGGGIWATAGSNYLYSTILSDNIDTQGADINTTNDLQGTFQEVDYCLVREGAPGAGYTLADGVPVGNRYAQDPRLAALADNGGPVLPVGALLTHALLRGSPAIDTGSNPLALPCDQRGPGYPREEAGGPDMGAYERTAPPGGSSVMVH